MKEKIGVAKQIYNNLNNWKKVNFTITDYFNKNIENILFPVSTISFLLFKILFTIS